MIYALRFMVDTGMGGGSWVELPAGSWKRVPQEQVGAGGGGWRRHKAGPGHWPGVG